LHFEQVGNNTVLNISTNGNVANKGVDQKVTLENVSLTDLGYSSSASGSIDQQIIHNLLQQGKLITD
jgi:hypothetical protein